MKDKLVHSLRRLLCGLVLGATGSGATFAAGLPDDSSLYYRRTHGGELPPAGVDASDHSRETDAVVPAGPVILDRRRQADLLDRGVDPANLGKGDWIWRLSDCQASLGLANGDVQGVINQAKAAGLQWITVKCGDNGNVWTQFNTDLIDRAHAAGLKIFGWAYVYGGADTDAEINVALNALNLGADGFIIDAEIEYEAIGQKANATKYAGAIKAAFPNRFLAHAPFPIISSHTAYPYVEFGTLCDAVMPQAYWADIGGTAYAAAMVTRMNTEWNNWQGGLSGPQRNAIKPIIPIGQGYNSVKGNVDGAQIETFMSALRTIASPASVGGYRGVSFWSFQHHSAAPSKWPAITAASIGDAGAYFTVEPLLDRIIDSGGSVSFTASGGGTAPLRYQWRFNGQPIAGATNPVLSLANLVATQSGGYSVTVSNTIGGAVSRTAQLQVVPPQTTVFRADFDDGNASGWTVNKSSADTFATFGHDYAANGIPSAPHSVGGTTRGVKLEANRTTGAAAAVSLSPIGQSFSGDHRLRFDVWINVNGPLPGGGVGSTEFITSGVGTVGSRVQWTGTGSTADGTWFAFDGDGGVSDTTTSLGDYSALAGTVLQSVASGVYAAGTDALARGNGHPYYVAAVPGAVGAPAAQKAAYAQQTGVLNAGAAGFAWHDVIVSRRGSTVDWIIDGVRMATVSGVSTSPANVFVGYWDPFTSISDNPALSFGLVDNVRVEIPAVAPVLTLVPTNTAVKLGATVQFAASATGLPEPTFQWRLDGTPLNSATNAVLVRTNVWISDVGAYSVVASNVAGTATSAAQLLVLPAAPAQFQSILVQSDSGLRLTAAGESGGLYLLDMSTNLVDWAALTSAVATNGVLQFELSSEQGIPERFFRTRSWP